MANLDPNARFERQRLLAKQEQNQANQQASEAMQRRLAAQGRLNSGSAIKGEQKIQTAGNQALTKRLGEIQDSEDTETLRREEIADARKFQTSEREASQLFGKGEREASQLFAADQAKLGREFQTSERLGGQDFASKEAGKSRDFSRSEREAGQNFASNEALLGRYWQAEQNGLQRAFQHTLQKDSLAQQLKMFNQQFALDEEVTRFNMEMAKSEANKKDIFQRIGDLGTSFWKDLSGQKQMSNSDRNAWNIFSTLI